MRPRAWCNGMEESGAIEISGLTPFALGADAPLVLVQRVLVSSNHESSLLVGLHIREYNY